MANKTFTELTAKAAPTTSDEIPIWDVTASQAKKATINNIINARLTGGGSIATGGFTLTLGGTSSINGTLSGAGTVATGGFTLTVPATGTAALLGTAQTFTKGQIVAPDTTGGDALVASMPASTTATAMVAQYNGTNAIRMIARAALTQIVLDARDFGNNTQGCQVTISRNSNAGAEGPAAGVLNLVRANGNGTLLWVDATATLRIHSAAPTGSSGSPTTSDTAGTVVGAQTSNAAFKDVHGAPVGGPVALQMLRDAAGQVKRFTYKSGAFGQEFSGLVIDGESLHRYGMDADPEHPAGKSLNLINVIGDLLLAVDHLTKRLEALEGAK